MNFLPFDNKLVRTFVSKASNATTAARENSTPELCPCCLISRPVYWLGNVYISAFTSRGENRERKMFTDVWNSWQANCLPHFVGLLALWFSLPALQLCFILLFLPSIFLSYFHPISLSHSLSVSHSLSGNINQTTEQQQCHHFSGLFNSCWLDSRCNNFCFI